MSAACFSGNGLFRNIDDASITSEVLARLIRDPQIERSRIKVITDEGRVYLIGRVASFKQRSKAEGLARAVEGVWSVRNYLKTGALFDPELSKKDDSLVAALNKQLRAKGLSAFSGLTIHGFEGELYLLGRVGSYREYRAILTAAGNLEGVRAVHDELKYDTQK